MPDLCYERVPVAVHDVPAIGTAQLGSAQTVDSMACIRLEGNIGDPPAVTGAECPHVCTCGLSLLQLRLCLALLSSSSSKSLSVGRCLPRVRALPNSFNWLCEVASPESGDSKTASDLDGTDTDRIPSEGNLSPVVAFSGLRFATRYSPRVPSHKWIRSATAAQPGSSIMS
jgi:hypothetical protein